MLPYRNLELLPSIIFFLLTKIVCGIFIWYRGMYSKRPMLTSIPERNENEEDLSTKWVPKKKHEVLKAKYKCLKKLFQIYDASVIGMLPEACDTDGYLDEEIQTKRRRKKRSHRTKTDASAGTNETSLTSGDVTARQSVSAVTEKGTIANAVMRELKMTNLKSCTSTQIDMRSLSTDKILTAHDSRDNIQSCNLVQDCEGTQTCEPRQHQVQHQMQHQVQQNQQNPVPYLVLDEKRRLTRFQCFIQRILGIRGDKNYVMPSGHVYASSDNNINLNHNYTTTYNNYSEKRRRRGLRFRRLKRPKKIQSESALRDMESPNILTYMQSVQRNCLMDTTQRQCPFPGCRMTSNGIINYNDHLVLCHFPEKKYICHYCHEGFEREIDKLAHEDEHLGIAKLGTNMSTPVSRQSSRRVATARITQTEPDLAKSDEQSDKLKKIVSFFEKMNRHDQIYTGIKKNGYSEADIRSKHEMSDTGYTTDSTDKKTVICVNLGKKAERKSSTDLDLPLKRNQSAGINCHLCGEDFKYRRQLGLHLDLDHGEEKYRSCSGLHRGRSSNHVDMVSEDGKINVQSIDRSHSRLGRPTASSSTVTSYTEISRMKSEESLSFDPSTNIVYYTSMESVARPPPPTFEPNSRGGNSYKWEPGTKIIHV